MTDGKSQLMILLEKGKINRRFRTQCSIGKINIETIHFPRFSCHVQMSR